MVPNDELIKLLREDIKKHRDQLRLSSEPELVALAASLDTFLLVSYDPKALMALCKLMSDFLNKQIGSDN